MRKGTIGCFSGSATCTAIMGVGGYLLGDDQGGLAQLTSTVLGAAGGAILGGAVGFAVEAAIDVGGELLRRWGLNRDYAKAVRLVETHADYFALEGQLRSWLPDFEAFKEAGRKPACFGYAISTTLGDVVLKDYEPDKVTLISKRDLGAMDEDQERAAQSLSNQLELELYEKYGATYFSAALKGGGKGSVLNEAAAIHMAETVYDGYVAGTRLHLITDEDREQFVQLMNDINLA